MRIRDEMKDDGGMNREIVSTPVFVFLFSNT